MFEHTVHIRLATPPEDEIRRLRAAGKSLAEVAREAGTTIAVVRRVVGKLDQAAIRRRQEETALAIDAMPLTWGEKVEKWKEQTGQCGVTLWRVLNRLRGD